MNNSDEESIFGDYDAAAALESAHFQNGYRTFEFEGMSEVPLALGAYISHPHISDLLSLKKEY
ncbi:MAG: hypothetical protein JKY29_09055 [Gammaproteobacteria bacterium]|nr:hypothetical protein [Gammaproteobacteria bacterium]